MTEKKSYLQLEKNLDGRAKDPATTLRTENASGKSWKIVLLLICNTFIFLLKRLIVKIKDDLNSSSISGEPGPRLCLDSSDFLSATIDGTKAQVVLALMSMRLKKQKQKQLPFDHIYFIAFKLKIASNDWTE